MLLLLWAGILFQIIFAVFAESVERKFHTRSEKSRISEIIVNLSLPIGTQTQVNTICYAKLTRFVALCLLRNFSSEAKKCKSLLFLL